MDRVFARIILGYVTTVMKCLAFQDALQILRVVVLRVQFSALINLTSL